MLDPNTFLGAFPALMWGLLETLKLFSVSLVCGSGLALVVAVARNSSVLSTRWFGIIFVFVFRGTPLLVLLYLIYYGLPQLALIRNSSAWILLREPYICALLALSLNAAGYMAEILSGAIRSVPRGEVEAAVVAGFHRLDVFRLIVLPHALRIGLRAYSNEIVFLIKGTAAASLVTVIELMGAARAIYFNTYDPFTPFLAAGVLYFGLVLCVTRTIAAIERVLSPELRVITKEIR
jgi:octopine/nopaline transport system permease protein